MPLKSTTVSWRPILTGVTRKRALAVVTEIAASLPTHMKHESPDASLASGHAGLAVTYAYLAQSGLSNNRITAAHLNRATQIISSETTGPSLHGGITGVAWALAHLQKQFLDPKATDIQGLTDKVLYRHLDRASWEGDYDLIDGLVGVGVYLLERLPDPIAIKCLERVVDRLAERAVCHVEGIAFPSRARPLPGHPLNQGSSDYYDIGVAHGVAGVIAFLGGVCAAGVSYEKARALLNGAVHWLISQKMDDSPRGCFPYYVGSDIRRKRARLAWCYGDAGIASALLLAARCVKESVWEREALKIARSAANRTLHRTEVVDAPLCHGAAGLGHIFNRIFQATDETWWQQAALLWFQRTLQLKVPGEGIAGFLTFTRDDNGEARWIEEAGLLEGAAGIALALLAAATSIEPAWDRVLLLSLRAMPVEHEKD